MVWSLLRLVVVSRTLSKYGVNPWIYGGLDLALAWPYAVASAAVVTNLIDRRGSRALVAATVAGVAFLLPDLYLMVAGHGKPRLVYVVVGAVATLFGVIAVGSVVVKVRKGWQKGC